MQRTSMLLVLRGLEAYTADHSCDLDAIGQDRGRRVCGSVDQRLVLLLVSLSPPPSRNGADGLEDRPRLGNRTLPAPGACGGCAQGTRAAEVEASHLRGASVCLLRASICHVTSERKSIAVRELMLTSICTASVGSSTGTWYGIMPTKRLTPPLS